ncbi:MAG TPA: DegT/DnrJ/EryC1/StrS family aminotransferase [Vicinamibacterales bacterium]|nr:DegT/DnrJ/EryC1/StrS family aminotransferase [Vicinamibacterales bacterium]
MRSWTGTPITLSAPDVRPADGDLLRRVLDSGALSNGPMVRAFETAWSARFGCRQAVAVSSGTAALHLAVIAAGVSDGDLVITTPFSFVASANVVLYERAVPIFVDIDPESLAIDPRRVEEAADAIARGGRDAAAWLPPSLRPSRRRTPRRLAAVLPVHVFGRAADLDPLMALASRLDVPVIEDACEAIGTTYRGRAAGTIGRAGAFGFYPNKQMTTGEGGMFVTDDDGWAAVARSLRNQGREGHRWLDCDRLGYNYRLDELSAALGHAQLARIDELLARRASVAAMYAERLAGHERVRMPSIDAPGASWFVYVVRLDPCIDRNQVMRRLADLGIPTRAYFPPIHLQTHYRQRFGYREGMFPIAEAAGRQAIALPFHNHLTGDQVSFICEALDAAMRET